MSTAAPLELMPSPQTCHWGVFDARMAPVLEIDSGDRVTVHTISGGPDMTPGPDSGYTIPPELVAVHREVSRPSVGGGHILTGPIAVRGAKPGHVLEVRILDVKPRMDWGYNIIRPLAGALPHDFAESTLTHIGIDIERNVGILPWGKELPLKPFFGVMGVAPPPAWGAISTIQPRAHGGNLDNKELVAGATLFLPVWAEGALFSVGDGHGCQGDGEVCVSAIETGLTGTFEFILHTDRTLTLPLAETPEAYITMAFDADLDEAARIALRRMLDLIQERSNLSREQAYTLCSLAADMRITQMVNHQNGVHCVLRKDMLHG